MCKYDDMHLLQDFERLESLYISQNNLKDDLMATEERTFQSTTSQEENMNEKFLGPLIDKLEVLNARETQLSLNSISEVLKCTKQLKLDLSYNNLAQYGILGCEISFEESIEELKM